ncbi:hypothetical protein [Candidatus Sodalis pierantonius]|uniref:hypothetical protein n=1 Tax=Candidatus Sodalis pierantonii TaxID=1486991 RepID=UPI003AA8E5DE
MALLIYSAGTATDLGVASAVAGLGVISIYLKPGCTPRLTAANLNRCCNPGGTPFPGLIFIIPAAGWSRRRCARLLILFNLQRMPLRHFLTGK